MNCDWLIHQTLTEVSWAEMGALDLSVMVGCNENLT